MGKGRTAPFRRRRNARPHYKGADIDICARIPSGHQFSALRKIKRRAMTESEWLSCQDPMRMLAAGGKGGWAIPSERKQVLFAAALLGWDESLIESFTAIHPAPDKYQPVLIGRLMKDLKLSVRLVHNVPGKKDSIVLDKTPAQVADVLREIVGNPLRPMTLPPAEYLRYDGIEVRSTPILSRHRYATPQVLSLAQAAYDERHMSSSVLNPDRLAILADSLEEEGCKNHTLLLHLRGYVRHYGPLVHDRSQYLLQDDCWYYKRSDCQHYRGCWALDLILGKS